VHGHVERRDDRRVPVPDRDGGRTDALLQLIRRIRTDLGLTIILIAHDIPLVMNLADRIQVLNFGSLIAEGDPATVRSDPEVVAAYIGTAKHA